MYAWAIHEKSEFCSIRKGNKTVGKASMICIQAEDPCLTFNCLIPLVRFMCGGCVFHAAVECLA